MSRCKNCGVEMSPEETCVFATYRTSVGGREIVVCCQNCARDLEQAAAQPSGDKLPGQAPPKKASPKRAAPKKAAPKKAGRHVRSAKKAPAKKTVRRKAKNQPKGKTSSR